MADIREDEARIIGDIPSDGAEQPDVVDLDTPQMDNVTLGTKNGILEGIGDIREDEARIIGDIPSDGAEQPDVVDLDTLQAGNLMGLEEKNIGEDEVRMI